MEMKLLEGFLSLACFFLNTAKSHCSCNCNDNLTTVCVPVGEDVPVPCYNVTSSIMTFKLLWNGKETFMKRFSSEDSDHLPGGDADVQLIKRNETFNLRLGKVNSSSHGIYRCEVEVIWPPPKLTQSNPGILLLVEEHQCKSRKKVEKAEGAAAGAAAEEVEAQHLSIWIPIVTIMGIYSLIVSVTLVVSCVRLQTATCDNEYMNTKPPTPRAHWWKA